MGPIAPLGSRGRACPSQGTLAMLRAPCHGGRPEQWEPLATCPGPAQVGCQQAAAGPWREAGTEPSALWTPAQARAPEGAAPAGLRQGAGEGRGFCWGRGPAGGVSTGRGDGVLPGAWPKGPGCSAGGVAKEPEGGSAGGVPTGRRGGPTGGVAGGWLCQCSQRPWRRNCGRWSGAWSGTSRSRSCARWSGSSTAAPRGAGRPRSRQPPRRPQGVLGGWAGGGCMGGAGPGTWWWGSRSVGVFDLRGAGKPVWELGGPRRAGGAWVAGLSVKGRSSQAARAEVLNETDPL